MFGETYIHYRDNFVTALAFAILLIFIPILALVSSVNIESGTALIDYSIVAGDAMNMIITAGLAIIFLFFYSMFTSMMIFAVRRDMATVKLRYHLIEQIEKFSFKIFVYYLIVAVVVFAINAIAVQFGISLAASSAISLLIVVLLMFVPQSIVIDEFSVGSAIQANLDFIGKNPGYLLYVLFIGSILVGITTLVEYAIDYVFFIGHYLTPIIVLVFIVPFIESLKSVIYLKKYDLLVARAHRGR